MSGATASLPDLQGVTNAGLNARSGLSGFMGVALSLAGGGGQSPLNGVSTALSGLEGVLHIDMSGLSEKLPRALTVMENALPGDALRFLVEIQDAYRSVSSFLSESALVKQIPQGGSLEQAALAMVDEVFALFRDRLSSLGSELFDADTLAQVTETLAALESMASGSPPPAEDLLDFLSQNLLGLSPDLLASARAQLTSRLAFLAPFSLASLEGAVGATRDALAVSCRAIAEAIRDFDVSDLAAYTALEALLQGLADAMDAAFSALESLYAVLTAAVSSSSWDAIFEGYAALLNAIALDRIPSVDDAVDALAGTLESLLSRLTMSLSPQELAERVTRMSGTIHALFEQSSLSQVQQILIGYIERIQVALEEIPVDQVQQAVEGMLGRVRQEIDGLGITEVRETIQEGFQAASDFIDDQIGDGLAGNGLMAGVNDSLSAALNQFQTIPIAEMGETLATAVQSVGQVITDLEASLASGLEEIRTLLETLDTIDFRPVSDSVIEEIQALKTKLQAINPQALSDMEKVAIQAALSILSAIDLEGMIENELKKGFNALDDELIRGVQAIMDAWQEFRRRIGVFDPSIIASLILDLLDQVGKAVQGLNGAMVVAPLQTLLQGLLAQLEALSPARLLDPLQSPYDRMMQTLQRANPDVWVAPLRLLHQEIDRLVNLVDITPLLGALEQKERELFSNAQQAVSDALDSVHLSPPLDSFYAQMKTLVLALTDAVFADPDASIRQFNLTLSTSFRPSSLFQPLDMAFDKLMAMVDALPQEQVLGALESIRLGLGTALPLLDPANILKNLREAQGRLAALSPGNLPGLVALPSLHAGFSAKLELSSEHLEAKASLMARFSLVMEPLSQRLAGSRLSGLTAAHQGLLASMRRKINTLDASGSKAAFQRLDAGLRRLLPDFLTQQSPLEMAAVHAGLAALRPSTKARRLDQGVDRFLAALAPLESSLEGAVGGFFQEIRQAALVLHPGGLKASVAGVYDTLRAKLHVLDPEGLASSLRENLWEPLMDPLEAINPAVLKAQLHGLYMALLEKITASINGLLDQIKQAIDAFLGQIRQALNAVLASLKQQIEEILAGVTALMENLDRLIVEDIFQRLLNLLENLKVSFDRELDRVGNEFNAMLNAAPLGAESSGTASAGASASVGVS